VTLNSRCDEFMESRKIRRSKFFSENNRYDQNVIL
jgi:hypothetical protein